MKEKAITAAARYLERKGYEVIDMECGFDLVAKDDEYLVFVTVQYAFSELPEDIEFDRSKLEKDACKYLLSCNEEEIKVRFDNISLAILGNDKALLKHGINLV